MLKTTDQITIGDGYPPLIPTADPVSLGKPLRSFEKPPTVEQSRQYRLVGMMVALYTLRTSRDIANMDMPMFAN